MILAIDKKKLVSFRTMLIFFAIPLFLYVIFLINGVPPYNNIIGSLTFLILNLIVVIILFYVAKKYYKYNRNAFIGWFLIALSQLATLCGNITWMVLTIGFNQYPFPSVADIFYLIYFPLLITGILCLPTNQTQEFKKYQILLDTGILIVSAALVLWVILIAPIIETQQENTFSIVISSSYVLLDIFMLVTLFYLLLNWFGQIKKMPLLLLAMSAATLAITNVIFTYQFLYGVNLLGGFLDIGWLISYALTALAGISYMDNKKVMPFSRFQYKFSYSKSNWSSYLPLLWLFFVYILLFWIYIHPEDASLNILIVGAAIVITIVFIRQILALKESNKIQELLQNNQEILKTREKHLSLITDNMMDLITRSNAKGEYEYVSPSAKKILGYKPRDMLGKNILDFVHPDDLEKVKSSIQKAVHTPSLSETDYLNEVEYRHKTSSGSYIWIETAGTPIFDHGDGLSGFVCSSRNINDRKRAEKQIKASLEEKEVLLKEIHHRVKNNMQIISSLLSLQSRYIKDENYLAIFKESQNRVRSMAMIHEGLYRTHNLARINFEKYIQNLIYGLFSSYGIDQSIIKTKMDLNEVLLDIDTAIPCGLILNELITNSLKHAFPEEREGEINVLLSQKGNILQIIVGDNGIGFPENIDFQNTESLGLQLVNTLVDQLKGEIKIENNNGTKFIFTLEKNN